MAAHEARGRSGEGGDLLVGHGANLTSVALYVLPLIRPRAERGATFPHKGGRLNLTHHLQPRWYTSA
jgi:hypothetical protein